MVGRLDRQGTGLCRLSWDADETGKRPFETRFRMFCLLGATEETLCSSVEWLNGFVTGMNWIKVSEGVQASLSPWPFLWQDGFGGHKPNRLHSDSFHSVAVSLAIWVRRP